MENSKSKIIKDIAENLNCGNNCHYNFKTDEIVAIPNFSYDWDEEEFQELYKSDLERVTKHKADFIKIAVLESFESFKIMERFVNQMPENKLKSELEGILQKKKPFQNFKDLIEQSDYRKLWFEFKQNELEKIVEKDLERGKANT